MSPAFQKHYGVTVSAKALTRLLSSIFLLRVGIVDEFSIRMRVAYVTICGPDEEQSGFIAFAMGVEPVRKWRKKNDTTHSLYLPNIQLMAHSQRTYKWLDTANELSGLRFRQTCMFARLATVLRNGDEFSSRK